MSVSCRVARVAALCLFAAVAACRPGIGDRCTVSTDCSTQGDRVCDIAQFGGYCTVLNCTSNSCPDRNVCVAFQPSVAGCAYDDYGAPGRTSNILCMAKCSGNSDCRQSDGYVCADPRGAPWFAALLDTDQGERVCIRASALASYVTSDAGVCSSSFPEDSGDGAAGDGAADAGGGAVADAVLDAPNAGGRSSDALDVGTEGAASDAAGGNDAGSNDAASDGGANEGAAGDGATAPAGDAASRADATGGGPDATGGGPDAGVVPLDGAVDADADATAADESSNATPDAVGDAPAGG